MIKGIVIKKRLGVKPDPGKFPAPTPTPSKSTLPRVVVPAFPQAPGSFGGGVERRRRGRLDGGGAAEVALVYSRDEVAQRGQGAFTSV